jgi:putative peptide zinc metalloprotease protein
VAQTFTAAVLREVPGASERLPSQALAVTGGGRFAVDPRAPTEADAEHPRTLVPVFHFDLEVPAHARLDALGMRVYVRFDHEPAPIAAQVYRTLRRTMLRLFQT